MRFKTLQVEQEYATLFDQNKNQRLGKLLVALELFVSLEFGKELTLTSIFRTQEEHDALYAHTPPDKRPARSPHMDWGAVDLRSSDFTQEEITKMLSFLNCFSRKDGKKVAIYHTISGNVAHFHIQYT